MTHHVKLSAHDDKPERLSRLKRLADGLHVETKMQILEVHDQRGTLCVNWLGCPRTAAVVEISVAWRTADGLSSNHYSIGTPVLLDAAGVNPFDFKARASHDQNVSEQVS